jgi:5'-3' exonuclease
MIDWKKNMAEVKVLIDSGGLIYSSTMGTKVLDEVGNPIREDNKFVYKDKAVEEVCYHADNILLQLFSTLQCTHYLGFVDTEFSNSFRRKINPHYKKNRDDKVPPKFIKELKKHLIQEWGFIPSKGIEADDLVSIYANHYKEQPIILYSNDKDVLNLPYLTYNGIKCTIQQNTEEHYKEFFWKSMIIGDSADHIRALKGKGEKFADKLFQENNNDLDIIPKVIFNEYLKLYGEFTGIQEFYRTYNCLHMIKDLSELPEDYKVEIQEFIRVPGTF